MPGSRPPWSDICLPPSIGCHVPLADCTSCGPIRSKGLVQTHPVHIQKPIYQPPQPIISWEPPTEGLEGEMLYIFMNHRHFRIRDPTRPLIFKRSPHPLLCSPSDTTSPFTISTEGYSEDFTVRPDVHWAHFGSCRHQQIRSRRVSRAVRLEAIKHLIFTLHGTFLNFLTFNSE